MRSVLQFLTVKKAGLAVVIVLLLGAGAYFLVIKNNEKESNQASTVQEDTRLNKTGENSAQTGEENRIEDDAANNKQDSQNATSQDNELVSWEIYKDAKYGFEMKYPKDVFSLADSSEYAHGVFLKSYDVTSIEESNVQSMQIIVEGIKDSAYNDAKNKVAEAPAYATATGPETKQIDGKETFVTTYKLYDGGEGIEKSYYFPNFVLTFNYANDEMEGKFRKIEEKIIPTLKFAEKQG